VLVSLRKDGGKASMLRRYLGREGRRAASESTRAPGKAFPRRSCRCRLANESMALLVCSKEIDRTLIQKGVVDKRLGGRA